MYTIAYPAKRIVFHISKILNHREEPMKILITILFFLNVSVAHAEENIFFSQIPEYISADQAVAAVKAAALKKRWTVYGMEGDKLRIDLDHRGYKAILKFSFSARNIHYSDHTTFYNESFDEDPFGEALGKWEKSPAPARWIANLKNEVNIYFNSVPAKESFSSDDVEKKLETLKNMYEKKLITEEEYQSKKKEIMSRY